MGEGLRACRPILRAGANVSEGARLNGFRLRFATTGASSSEDRKMSSGSSTAVAASCRFCALLSATVEYGGGGLTGTGAIGAEIKSSMSGNSSIMRSGLRVGVLRAGPGEGSRLRSSLYSWLFRFLHLLKLSITGDDGNSSSPVRSIASTSNTCTRGLPTFEGSTALDDPSLVTHADSLRPSLGIRLRVLPASCCCLPVEGVEA